MTARMRTRRLRALLLLGAALSAMAMACGGAVPAKKAPESAYPTDAPAAEPGPPYPGYGQPAQPGPVAPSPPPESPEPNKRKLETAYDAEGAMAEDQQMLDELLRQPQVTASARALTCQRVCAALASMRRSVDALCELTGEEDERCKRARERLETNERRVADSGCSC